VGVLYFAMQSSYSRPVKKSFVSMSEVYEGFGTHSTLNGKDRDTEAGHLENDVAASPLLLNHGRDPRFGTLDRLDVKDQPLHGLASTDLMLPDGLGQTLDAHEDTFRCEVSECGKSYSSRSSLK
jgi:hypothetical protein